MAIIEVRLPQFGRTMEEGTIVNCLVNVGDEVKRGDVLFEVETDKVSIEMESPADGFVKYILVETGRTLPVGQTLIILAERNERVPPSFVDSLKASAAVGSVPAAQTEPPPPPALAAEPAGPSMPAPEPRLGAVIPLNKLQKITAQKMLRSKREIPCFYLTVKADVTDLVELRTKLNKTSDVQPVRNSVGNNMTRKGEISNVVKISYNDFIMRAVAIGLKKFPIMTGQLVGDTIRLADSIGIGLAIFVTDGLVAPIVKDVDKKDIALIARDRQGLIEKARNSKLAACDLEGGCITISNLGGFGIESFIPIVVPGQCSILGVGQITDVCVADNSDIVVRKLMSITLSADHRITNGAYAARFLDFVRKLLEDSSNFV